MLSDPRALAREWLARAQGNLDRARQEKPPRAFWEDLCFDCQQAAEKAIKSVLVLHEIEFPKIHEIEDLLGLAEGTGVKVPETLWDAERLSQYAVETRYPGRTPPVTEEEYRRAVALAEQVVRWAEGIIHAG